KISDEVVTKLTAAAIIERNPGGMAPLPTPGPVAVSRVTLPAQNERFVGRIELLDEIRRRMETPGAFAITSLRGVAGVGKSALALEAAYRFADLFPDGRYWLDLRSGDAAQVLRTLLIELGVTNQEQLKGDLATLAGLVRGQLAGQRVLLVLDNAETIARHRPAAREADGFAGACVHVDHEPYCHRSQRPAGGCADGSRGACTIGGQRHRRGEPARRCQGFG
ncbi:MAG: hypothetical protein IPK16_20485, partial [Anaerolineales bacterium]|nr:hypothetical protein [Anaerolineales bacterium]